MKEKINAFDYAEKFAKGVSKGFLLTTKAGDQIDSMVIGWGTIGIQWGKPICIVYVRTSRYTHELLDANPEFTVNIPVDTLNPKIFHVCGSMSAREVDKVAEAGLTLEEGAAISVPGIAEAPITLECKVIYRQTQVREEYAEDVQRKFYSGEDPGSAVHTAFYGEIVNAYIIR